MSSQKSPPTKGFFASRSFIKSVRQEPPFSLVEVVKDLHFYIVAAENSLAGFGNIVVAMAVVESHDPALKQMTDRANYR